MNTTEAIMTDGRFQATGPGAYFTLTGLLREHLHEDEVHAIASRSTYLCNTDAWRPTDALRQAAREHLRGEVYRGCNA